jgi:hypothetical protein
MVAIGQLSWIANLLGPISSNSLMKSASVVFGAGMGLSLAYNGVGHAPVSSTFNETKHDYNEQSKANSDS